MLKDDPAVRARESVAAAHSGLLTTYARHPAGQTSANVRVRPRPDGTLEIELARETVSARQLIARPVATLELHPIGREPVLLHGAARRLPGVGLAGPLIFHLDVAAVRVGTPAVLLDEREYAAATPDPLAAEAAGVLEHLNGSHGEALAACLRAVGHHVGFVYALRLDTDGLTVAAVADAGVEIVLLRFPRPVTDLRHLPVSLSLVLQPECPCAGTARSVQDGRDHDG